jgi:nucleotide-binding universal stress UspA family protein
VVAVDPDSDEERMLALAFARAERLGVPLVAVHAVGGPRFPDLAGSTEVLAHGHAHGHDAFDVLMDKWAAAEPVARLCRVKSEGPAATAILTAAAEAQLIVVGKQSRRLPSVVLGSTLRALLHYADCPVAVVPELPKAGENR